MVEGVKQSHDSDMAAQADAKPNLDSNQTASTDYSDHQFARTEANLGLDAAELELQPEPESRSHSPWRGFFIGSTFLLTAMVSAGFGAWLAMVSPLPPQWFAQAQESFSLRELWKRGIRYQVDRPVNILIMGIDRVPDAARNSPEVLSGRTDTMLLVRVDHTDNQLTVLSIPRDTQVEIPGYGVTKINQANVIGGPSMSARIVSRTLNDVPIDRYVRVSTEAFREVVDLVGGVEVYVPEPMEYTDQTQDLYIDLPQGWQTLSGDEAEQFARFRSDGFGDIGRVQRQQQLLSSLRDRIMSPSILPQIPQIMRVAQQYLDTNLSLEEMLALANFALNLDEDSFQMVMLPGRFSDPNEYVASYWIRDPDAGDRIMNDYFGATVASDVTQRAARDLHIAVQNATGEPYIAREVADYLQQQGFYDVYVVNDWPDPIRQTQIIAQQGDVNNARIIESVLGIGRVVSASTGNIESDLTIRIGEDWVQQLTPDTDTDAAEFEAGETLE